MNLNCLARFCIALVAGILVVPVRAADAPPKPPAIDYNRDIRPIFANRCIACHGPDEKHRKAGLRLDRKEDALKELESGETAIVPGQAAKSALIARVTSSDDDERMPPPKSGPRLSDAEITTLRQWIDQGAPWKAHWSLIPPERPAAPEVRNNAWARNPIDQFILARLEKEGLSPAPEADKAMLIRRVSLDLVGLPPTIAEVDAFLADNSPNAYEKVVDRLLSSPHYGERMAQHWLDAARYADTNGYHIDNHRDMWKWREWVIAAFNKNMPFDQFTIEQIAGDMLPGATLDQKIASGFNRNCMVNFEGGADPDEYATKYVVDRVVTTSTVWLGLTLQCTECHDHKYDPFTQKEFYQLYAFFNNVPEKGLDGSRANAAPNLMLPTPEQSAKLKDLEQKFLAETDALKPKAEEADKAQAAWEKKLHETKPAENASAAKPTTNPPAASTAATPPAPDKPPAAAPGAKPSPQAPPKSEKDKLPDNIAKVVAIPADKRTGGQKEELKKFFREKFAPQVAEQETKHKAQQKDLEKFRGSIDSSMVMEEMSKPRTTYILVRGDYRSHGEEVGPGLPKSLPSLPEGQPANRLGLAHWLVSKQHPLVSRVTVNRYWQQYFGVGLVKTSDDFGTRAETPSHPELLDWLATRFIDSGWDIRALQRLIVTSAAYRQTSVAPPKAHSADPENRLLARGPRFRLDAETIRDAALAAAGLLNQEIGGPSVFPYQPAGLWEMQAYGGDYSSQTYVQSKGDDLYRRGLYTYWKRSLPYASFTTFDAPNREICSIQRPRTNTPLQALVLLNDPAYIEAARSLATRTLREASADTKARISYAFRLCLARPPRAEEMAVLEKIVEQQLEHYRQDAKAAAALLSVGESKPPKDMDPSELAAWTALGNVLLNLDETITRG